MVIMAHYCEVMFDDATSGEVPEHQAFIYQAAIPALEKLGVPVRVLRSEKTYGNTAQMTF